MDSTEHHFPKTVQDLSPLQRGTLLFLRVAIGWHFLYEGIVKLGDPNWTSAGYLAESKWIFADIFQAIASNPAALAVVDFLNIWGLFLIGLALFFGVFTRPAAIAGMMMLALYYIANPPLISTLSNIGREGNYLVIDKNFVELLALGILAVFPTYQLPGFPAITAWFQRTWSVLVPSRSEKAEGKPQSQAAKISLPRRELIASLAAVPAFGGFLYAVYKKKGWESWEEKHLMAAGGDVDAVSRATMKTFNYSSLKDLKGQIPKGRIGNLELSRIFLGGNLMGGWAHARDLIYVSKLVKTYHSDEKVFETFHLAEQCGMNTILTNPVLARVINKYWRVEQGKIQFISDCAYKGDVTTGIRMSIDGGAHACYVQGGIADALVLEGKVEEIGKAVDLISSNGVPAGIGAHALETVKACVDLGLKPDFWVKTLHRTDYWSANPENQHDNIWCTNPEETAEYMREIEEPWIAFKILAAGAYPPEVGFKYAFENGADFICVGMYDFQVVDDANIALDILAQDLNRKRPWMA